MRGRLCGRGNFFFSVSTDVFVREIGTPRPRDRGLQAKRRRETKTRGASRNVGVTACCAARSSGPPRRWWRPTATAAATIAVAEPASPPYRRAKPSRDSPFSYRELDEAVARRRDQERALATYVNTVAPMIASARGEVRAQKLGDPAALERARARVRDARRARAGGDRGAHVGRRPGWPEEARRVRRAVRGAWGGRTRRSRRSRSTRPSSRWARGRGQWQRALAERGVDVLAYDDRSAVPGDERASPAGRERERPLRHETRSARKSWGVTR